MEVVSFPKQQMRELSKLVRKEQEVEQWSQGWETLWEHQAEGKEQILGEGSAGKREVGSPREPRM